jgi:hypothetical protein
VIRYALTCDKGDGFESWFKNSESYDRQAAAGLLACPLCGSTRIEKAIMAPQLARGGHKPPAAATEGEARPAALVSEQETMLRAKLRELRDYLTQNSDYVGRKFAEEARKIHLGEAEKRSIHGEASAEEAKALWEDGISFHPLPALPEERN